jgi:hypothetical protein
MIDLDKEIKIGTKDGRETSFHIIGNTVIPVSNLTLAENWLAAGVLTPDGVKTMNLILGKLVVTRIK